MVRGENPVEKRLPLPRGIHRFRLPPITPSVRGKRWSCRRTPSSRAIKAATPELCYRICAEIFVGNRVAFGGFDTHSLRDESYLSWLQNWSLHSKCCKPNMATPCTAPAPVVSPRTLRWTRVVCWAALYSAFCTVVASLSLTLWEAKHFGKPLPLSVYISGTVIASIFWLPCLFIFFRV